MNFDTLVFDQSIKKAITELGYTEPTEIQKEAIPSITEGKDILASAQTGTGKTAAFLLPALQRIAARPAAKERGQGQSQGQGKGHGKGHSNGPRILILVPTRELAMQVATEAQKFSKYLAKIKTVCIYGGEPYPIQRRQLSKPYEVLVATPGRLLDHMQAGRIDCSSVEMLILDEADRMLDMGFIDPVKLIASKTPKTRQTLLFSATLKSSVMKLARELLHNPIEIHVTKKMMHNASILQHFMHTDGLEHKYQILDSLLADPSLTQALIFTATKSQADTLAGKLLDSGQNVAALHGDMRQRQRTQTIQKLRLGKISVLVATDVAARGIDVLTISHVINFDLPNSTEDYVHRIGRTARAGNTGTAFSLVTRRDAYMVGEIERFTGQKMQVHTIKGLEPREKSQKPNRFQKKGPGAMMKKGKRRPFAQRSF